MKPLTRTNLILAAGVLLLGLINWFEPGLKPEAPERISSLDPGQIIELKLYRQQQLAVSLKREAERWVRLPPLADDCATPDCEIKQPDVIRQWLHFAELPSLHSFPAPGDRLQEFGLDNPAYRLQLDDLSILVGNLDPGSQLRYVLVNGQIHLVSDSYYHTLKKNP
jgi:hypothetical protein